jgi:hypothetical protein
MDENTKHIIAGILTVAYFQTTPHKMSLATTQKEMNPNTEADAFRKQAFFTYKEFLIMLNESETEVKK